MEIDYKTFAQRSQQALHHSSINPPNGLYTCNENARTEQCSTFPQTIFPVPHQRRQQIGDNSARPSPDFYRDRHAG